MKSIARTPEEILNNYKKASDSELEFLLDGEFLHGDMLGKVVNEYNRRVCKKMLSKSRAGDRRRKRLL